MSHLFTNPAWFVTCYLLYLLSSADPPQDQIISTTTFYLYCFLSIIPFLLCQIYYFSFSPFSFLFYCFQLELCNKTAAKSHYCPAPSVGLSLPIFSFSVRSFSQWSNIFTVIKYFHSDQIFSQWSNIFTVIKLKTKRRASEAWREKNAR